MQTLERWTATGTATSVCPYCGTGCRILYHGSSAFPALHHRISQGGLCLRGWTSAELFWSSLRLTSASFRQRGELPESLPVERALDRLASRLLEIRERRGSGSIGILGSARHTVEECRLLRRLAHALGTPHLDSFQRHGYQPLNDLGFEALDDAPAITVLAANLTVRHTQIGRRVLRAIGRGARVRFVHSGLVKIALMASDFVAPLPGHELSGLERCAPDELIVTTTALALAGQGAALIRALRGRPALFATDYVNQRGMVEAGIHPVEGGLSAWEMLRSAAAGELAALLVFGDDPFEFFPGLSAEAFARTEITAAVDAVCTPTTRAADLVLPGALLAEKQGHVVNFEGRSQGVVPVSVPPGDWTEGRLIEALLARLGANGEAPPPRVLPEPGPDALEPDRPSEAFPLIAALDTTSFWNTHALVAASVTAWREARTTFADFPPGYITLNPDDARELGVGFGGNVTVTSADGTVLLPTRLNPRVLKGCAWVPMHAWESAGTRLGALVYDPGLRIPVFRPRAVRVKRP